MEIKFTLRPEDATVLKKAAKDCGISVNQYLKEVVEVKVADLRSESLTQEESDVPVHR